MSTLSEGEREALQRATGHLSTACEDWRCETCAATQAAVEAIIAARLAPIEALADEWEREGRLAMDEIGFKVQMWRDWKRVTQLRAALTAVRANLPVVDGADGGGR